MKDTKNPLKISPDILARLNIFIKKYVDPVQEESAKALGLSQPSMSNLLSGKRAPTHKVWSTLITKYNMNQDWLMNGKGNPIAKPEKDKSPLLTDLTALNVQIVKMERRLQIYEVNQNFLFEVIDKLEKRLEILESA
jgi:transcriptional regulator with XRE-family HTH domain